MNKCMIIDRRFKHIFVILAIACILANIKSILNDYDLDAGYAVVMSYRQAQGEMMLSEMREPHQTSAFLSAVFIKIYLMMTGTTTGIVLYLQMMGVMTRGLFTVFFYYAMKALIRKDILMLMCLFFFSVTPKGLPLPEFSNMQVWFSLGLICSFIRYIHAQDKKWWLILSGIFLCLEVLSYPSCLIVYIGAVGLLAGYAHNKWTDIGIFTGVCACIGGLYCGGLLCVLEPTDVVSGIRSIVYGDGSHNISMTDKSIGYLREGVGILAFYFLIGITAYVSLRFADAICRQSKKEKTELCTHKNWGIAFFLILFISELIVILMTDMQYYIQVPMYVPIIIAGVLFCKYCSESEQRIFVVGTVVSVLSLCATLLLTNLTLRATLSYMIPAVMVAFIPMIRGIEKTSVIQKCSQYVLLFLFCGLIIFRNGYLLTSTSGREVNLLSVGGIVKEGPAAGIMSEYMGPYMLNSTKQEWEEWVHSGEKVLVVGSASYDPICYLFQDVVISMPSVISTPTYDEKLLEYWEKYPEKYPDVIIVDCWYGDLRVSEDSWIMQWLAKEYPECDYMDGKYWRYYRLRDI